MAPFYELICKEFNFPIDNNLLNQLKKTNEEKLKQIEEKLEDAQQNLGETEISDALISKAEYLAKIGYKVNNEYSNNWKINYIYININNNIFFFYILYKIIKCLFL